MIFNEQQTKEIENFIYKYNKDTQFKNSKENSYNVDTSSLNILEVYALEEVLRFGNKGIYKEFLSILKSDNLSQEVTNLISYVKLFNNDPEFKSISMMLYFNFLNNINSFERFALSNFCIKKYEIERFSIVEDKYDPLNKLKCRTLDELETTIDNLLLGDQIFTLLTYPKYSDIKSRLKDGNMISSNDKNTVIEAVIDYRRNMDKKERDYSLRKRLLMKEYIINELKYGMNDPFYPFKMYNTNISIDEVYEKKRK